MRTSGWASLTREEGKGREGKERRAEASRATHGTSKASNASRSSACQNRRQDIQVSIGATNAQRGGQGGRKRRLAGDRRQQASTHRRRAAASGASAVPGSEPAVRAAAVSTASAERTGTLAVVACARLAVMVAFSTSCSWSLGLESSLRVEAPMAGVAAGRGCRREGRRGAGREGRALEAQGGGTWARLWGRRGGAHV